jgi:hypothetical protein
MSTTNIAVTGTFLSPFSASDTYNVLHGGFLIDPFLQPLSFFYQTSVFGGEISSFFLNYLTGGDFNLSYDDLNENTVFVEGSYIFCETKVVFDFSNFDQSESKIVKIVFNPNNGNDNKTYNSYVSANQTFYPILSNISSIYYPSEEFYTYYNPSFLIQYEDGKKINVVVPLTSVQCGIFDSYKNKNIVEALPFYKKPSNVLLFINDSENDELILTNVSTSLLFELREESLPFSTETPLAVPVGEGLLQELETTTIQIPLPPTNENPVLPPFPTPTPTPVFGQGIVTLIDKIQIKTIGGDEIYPLGSKSKGMVTFEDFQIYSFANEELYPFDSSELTTFVSFENVTMFNGSNIIFFE